MSAGDILEQEYQSSVEELVRVDCVRVLLHLRSGRTLSHPDSSKRCSNSPARIKR
jgi:hypothetical protein